MKKIIGFVSGLLLAVLILWPFLVAFAIPTDITTMTANPSNTSMILTWVKASSSNNTLIRYRTDTFPSGTSDGIQVYDGPLERCTVGDNATGDNHTVGDGDNLTALTPGQAYYFSAWGDAGGGSYSADAFHLVMSTLAVAIPSGAQDQPINHLPIPTVPTQMNQNPDTGAFQLEPFTSIVKWFNDSPGGLGMPDNYAWENLAILGIVGGGFATYTKIRNWFVAYAVVFVLTFVFIGLHLVQGWLLGIEIVIGMGVWAIEHYLQ